MQLTELLIRLNKIDCFFRIENDEEGYYFSIIDRGEYPRIWADNFQGGKVGIIAETPDNILNKTILSGMDWKQRWHGENIEQIIPQVVEWIEKI